MGTSPEEANAGTMEHHDRAVEALGGRQDELARIDALLRGQTAALVLVMGEPGTGAAPFLVQVHEHATVAGWTVVPPNLQGRLSITSTTEVEGFRHQLQGMLGIDVQDILTGQRSYQPPVRPGEPSPRSFIEQLKQRAPLLLLIEGYEPEAAFAAWLDESFISDLRAANAPVVVVIADQTADMDALQADADERFFPTRLSEDGVRAHFQRIGRLLAPPLTAAELEGYVGASRDDADMLNRLSRVLVGLATPQYPSPPGPVSAA